MIVRAIWEFDVDDSEMSEEYVDIKGLCEELTERELDYCLKHNQLSAEDFRYEAHPELPSDWDDESEEIKSEEVLKDEYMQFIQTEKGKEWLEFCRNNMKSDGDFGDYLYDFYPEMLQ